MKKKKVKADEAIGKVLETKGIKKRAKSNEEIEAELNKTREAVENFNKTYASWKEAVEAEAKIAEEGEKAEAEAKRARKEAKKAKHAAKKAEREKKAEEKFQKELNETMEEVANFNKEYKRLVEESQAE